MSRLRREADLGITSKDGLETFNITLFGRTMTGKSTLYEILTNGDGTTIGNGSQRTTKDIRTYIWNGLKINDIPGIAAFEGQEDDEIAENAAKDADLLILLITDDAPQDSEAQHFAKIIHLGKPYLGIINIKAGIERSFDRKRFIDKEGYKNKFDFKHINGIFNSLKDLTSEYVGNHQFKIFIPTHLQSKFIGEKENNAKLIEISQFEKIENHIIKEVKQQGVFYRYNHYISLIIAVYLDLSKEILGYSEENSQLGRVVVDKKRQIFNWSEVYTENINDRIANEIKIFFAPLRYAVPSFIDEYIENGNIQNEFKRLVENHQIEDKIKDFQSNISTEAQRKIQDIIGELEQNISIKTRLIIHDRGTRKVSLFNTKRFVNWVTTGATGVLAITALIPGLNVAAAGMVIAVGIIGGIISMLFESKKDKLARAKEEATHKILRDLKISEYQDQKYIKKWFDKRIHI